MKSEFRTIKYSYENIDFTFTSDNGVFSKDRIDYGSKSLVETYLQNSDKHLENFLDVGCGYGFMGIVISKIKNIKGTLIDVNKRAVHLANMNIKNNHVDSKALLSDIYENVQDKYDLIITNPPIRAGKKIVMDILVNAREYLNKNGELWFVMRKEQGAKSTKKELENYYKIELIKKTKGFYIFRAKID